MQAITLSWTGDASGTYEVQYRKSTSSSWIEPSGSPVVGLSINISNLDDSTEYSFRVRKIGGSFLCDWVYQTYTTSSPGCVAVNTVTIGTITSSTASISWSSSLTAINGYIVQWKRNTALNWLSSPTITGNSYTISGLTESKAYDVKVVSLCAGSDTADSHTAHFTTVAATNLCTGISVTGVAITAGVSSYSASWTHTGGTPPFHVFEYSIDGGIIWIEVTSIVSQSSTSVVYNLPAVGEYPFGHKLRVTPKCSDGSLGIYDVDVYNAPDDPNQYVIYRNQLSSGNISFINIDGSPNVLTTPIGPGGNKHFNEAGLLNGTHTSRGKLTGVANGTILLVQHKRGASIISGGNVVWNGSLFPFANGDLFLDGDIFDVSEA